MKLEASGRRHDHTSPVLTQRRYYICIPYMSDSLCELLADAVAFLCSDMLSCLISSYETGTCSYRGKICGMVSYTLKFLCIA